MKKIYILGEARGVYRIQTVIALLLDNRKHYKVYYDSLFYCNPLFRYLKSLIVNPFVIARSDIVYVCTLNVDINIFYELLWAKILGKKIITDFYVSVYDTTVLDRKWFKEGAFLSKLAILCDKMFLMLGTKIIFLTNAEAQYYVRLAGVKKTLDSVIIPMGVKAKGKVESPFLKGKSNGLKICWWGSYLPLHGLETIIKAVKLVKEMNLPVEWYFFGDSEENGKPYVEAAKKYGVLDICTFSNECTFANGKLSAFLEKNCDVALGQFGDSQKSKNVLCNKFLEACSMSCILLTGEGLSLREYFGNRDDNIFICERKPEAIAETVQKILYSDKSVLRNRTEETYQCYQKNFTIQKLEQRMRAVIDEVGSGNK